MVILFSPSEGKTPGGENPPLSAQGLSFPERYAQRGEVLQRYAEYLRTSDAAALGRLFGFKDAEQIERYRMDPFASPTRKAVLRYDGVAYDYLDYASLDSPAQRYVDAHTIIFSNLFGPVGAADLLPEYKLKQGEKIGEFATETFYREAFRDVLDARLDGEEVMDLRAGFYDKFYKPSMPFTTLKFVKEGKVVSHWAKAYRGIVLRRMAQEGIESMRAFESMQIEGLMVKEILKRGLKTEIVFEIVGV